MTAADPRPLIRVLTVLIVLLLLGGVAGLLVVDEEPSAVALITAAPETVDDVQTLAMDFTSKTEAGGQTFEILSTGTIDAGAEAAEMKFRVPAAGLEYTIVSKENTGYLKVAPGSEGRAGGKQWVRVDLSAFSPDQSSTDPLSNLEYMRGVESEPREVGTEQVRGVQTTHYQFVVPVAALRDGMPEAMRDQLETLEDGGLEEIPMDVWLDEEGRPARVVNVIEATIAGQRLKTTTTIELYDWGKPPRVQVPSDADAFPAASLQDAVKAAGIGPQ